MGRGVGELAGQVRRSGLARMGAKGKAPEGGALGRGHTGTHAHVVRLEGESSNSFLETLEEWQSHLAHHDLNDLGCDDDDFAP